MHCFNHHLELSVQDAFKGNFFDKISLMLRNIYYLPKNNPKRLHELRAIFEKTEKTIKISGNTLDCTQRQGNGKYSCQLWHFQGSCWVFVSDRLASFKMSRNWRSSGKMVASKIFNGFMCVFLSFNTNLSFQLDNAAKRTWLH